MRRAQSFCHTACPLADLAADDVGLFEVDVGAVQDERLSPAEVVLKQALEPHSPPLWQASRDVHAALFAWVEVDVEVLGLQDLKLEVPIVDLVTSEVLR